MSKREMTVNREKSLQGIGIRIKQRRQRVGMTQKDLTAGLPVTNSYISLIESGRRVPSIDVLRMIAPRLGVSAAYLETGADVVDVRLPRKAVVGMIETGLVPRGTATAMKRAL